VIKRISHATVCDESMVNSAVMISKSLSTLIIRVGLSYHRTSYAQC